MDSLPCHRLPMFGWFRPRSVSPSKKNYDRDQDNYKNYKIEYILDKDESDRKRVVDSVDIKSLFDEIEMENIEKEINETINDCRERKFKRYTVDRTRLRTKFSFGEGYNSVCPDRRRRGDEKKAKLFPKGEVDPIPKWLKAQVIEPLEDAGLLREEWVNCAVICDYVGGGRDPEPEILPPQIFDRPIIAVCFFSFCHLAFNTRTLNNDVQVSKPLTVFDVGRGQVMTISGFAANDVSHGIKPHEYKERHAMIMLYHVSSNAPRMTDEEFAKLTGRTVGSRRWRSRDQSFSPTRGDPRRRSRGRSKGRGASWDRFRRRTRSGYRRSRRQSESRSPARRSRSRSRGRRRSRGRSRSPKPTSSKCDEFGRSKDIKKKVKKTLKSNGLSHMSSRTADKLLKVEKKEDKKGSDTKSTSISENNEPPVSKSIQSAILRNIIGDFGAANDHNENKMNEEDAVDDVVSKIISGEINNDKDEFSSRMSKIKSQVTNKAKAGAYGKVILDQSALQVDEVPEVKRNSSTEKERSEDELKDEAARLRKELLEMKEKIQNKKRKSRSPSVSATSSSESESEAESGEEEQEEEEESEVESESDDNSNDESDESDEDSDDSSDDEEAEVEGRTNVFDVFKTTVLQSKNSGNSKPLFPSRKRKSKQELDKILRERLKMMKNNKD